MTSEVVERIVYMLLSRDEPCTAQQVALEIGMSESSVRHGAAAVRSFCSVYGLALCSAPKRGFWVEGPESVRARVRLLLQDRSTAAGPAFRRLELLKCLVDSPAALTMAALCERLGLSKRALDAELARLEAWARGRSLGLARTPGVGVCVTGGEQARREALAAARYQAFLESPVSRPRPDDLEYRVTGTFWCYFSTFYRADDLRNYQNLLLRAERQLACHYEDSQFVLLLESLAVMRERARRFPARPDAEATAGLTHKELKAAELIANAVLGLGQAAWGEVAQLACLMRLYRMPGANQRPAGEGDDVGAFVDLLLVSLPGAATRDAGARERLAAKLGALVAKKAESRSYHALANQAFALDVRRSNPVLYALVLAALRLLEARGCAWAAGFDELDCAYAAMLLEDVEAQWLRRELRVLFVTSFDADVARYFQLRMERKVPGIKVASIVSHHRATQSLAWRYDVVVTSVLLEGVDAVKVSRRLDSADMQLIREEAARQGRERLRVPRAAEDLFLRPLALLGLPAATPSAVFEAVSDQLVARGVAQSSLAREMAGPHGMTQCYVGGLVAAALVSDSAVRRSTMVLVRLRRPIRWSGTDMVDVAVVLALTPRRLGRPETVLRGLYAHLRLGLADACRQAKDERALRAALRDMAAFRG